ncbi:MAG TPA: GNAT family N-acetyltransferase [Anaerolineae bacterium]
MPTLAHLPFEWESHPLSPQTWPDLLQLFEHHGNPGWCWCMLWRLPSAEYTKLASAERRQALECTVQAGTPTGVIGYVNHEPAGWCSIAPRETYARLEHSRTLQRIDDKPVWSIVCFFIKRSRRGRGIRACLLMDAIEYARRQGAAIVEAYPVGPHTDADGTVINPKSYTYMGTYKLFETAGFVMSRELPNGRRIMRMTLDITS